MQRKTTKLSNFWDGVSTGIAWLMLLIGVPLGLAVTGFFFKLLWSCMLAGWNLI